MKKIILFVTVATASLFWGCKKKAEIPEPFGETGKYTPKKIADAEWLIGNWENKSDDGDMAEIWAKGTDSSFTGQSFVLEGKDTVFQEKIQLIQRNDSLFYMVSIEDQNDGKPVPFYATKANASQLIFENPKHDFPKKIVYNKVNNDSIVAAIYGTVGSETFPMKRKR